eukprot:TRINITY_DN46116_c0_g1_i1.p1 TRINITY_DN46116_c0_g1~~TRINITY_DN46116_c0_g1_i1.p1  ORF type:complete len:683 (-),score=181.03 TRINITY_DN46116_c0_g1_i1:146-2194(-)
MQRVRLSSAAIALAAGLVGLAYTLRDEKRQLALRKMRFLSASGKHSYLALTWRDDFFNDYFGDHFDWIFYGIDVPTWLVALLYVAFFAFLWVIVDYFFFRPKVPEGYTTEQEIIDTGDGEAAINPAAQPAVAGAAAAFAMGRARRLQQADDPKERLKGLQAQKSSLLLKQLAAQLSLEKTNKTIALIAKHQRRLAIEQAAAEGRVIDESDLPPIAGDVPELEARHGESVTEAATAEVLDSYAIEVMANVAPLAMQTSIMYNKITARKKKVEDHIYGMMNDQMDNVKTSLLKTMGLEEFPGHSLDKNDIVAAISVFLACTFARSSMELLRGWNAAMSSISLVNAVICILVLMWDWQEASFSQAMDNRVAVFGYHFNQIRWWFTGSCIISLLNVSLRWMIIGRINVALSVTPPTPPVEASASLVDAFVTLVEKQESEGLFALRQLDQVSSCLLVRQTCWLRVLQIPMLIWATDQVMNSPWYLDHSFALWVLRARVILFLLFVPFYFLPLVIAFVGLFMSSIQCYTIVVNAAEAIDANGAIPWAGLLVRTFFARDSGDMLAMELAIKKSNIVVVEAEAKAAESEVTAVEGELSALQSQVDWMSTCLPPPSERLVNALERTREGAKQRATVMKNGFTTWESQHGKKLIDDLGEAVASGGGKFKIRAVPNQRRSSMGTGAASSSAAS